ncbi:hypothetical protein MUK42_16132 [Musa troglodytarum]|uniref:Uncharacterized protein n=1 Tax=Musa troglodytarum TaxID=320322 RepID=A0A9E7KKF2_9LILI|nr:hypothetical protein MUK42_16132 [Musa troglodytarum]
MAASGREQGCSGRRRSRPSPCGVSRQKRRPGRWSSRGRAASLAGAALYRRLCSSLNLHRPIVRLLPPVHEPSRGFARGREAIPSDVEEEASDDEEDFDDDLGDLDEGFDGENDVDEDGSEFDGNDSRDESD